MRSASACLREQHLSHASDATLKSKGTIDAASKPDNSVEVVARLAYAPTVVVERLDGCQAPPLLFAVRSYQLS